MLFSALYKIVANKVTFVGFSGGDRPYQSLDLPLIPSYSGITDYVRREGAGRPCVR